MSCIVRVDKDNFSMFVGNVGMVSHMDDEVFNIIVIQFKFIVILVVFIEDNVKSTLIFRVYKDNSMFVGMFSRMIRCSI